MRKILFRGKDKFGGRWIEGSLLVFPDTGRMKILVWNRAELDFDGYEVFPETVGQYVGAEDITGRKVFEGDVLRFVAEDGYTGEIYTEAKKWLRYVNECIFSEMEIVGNVHDNPELKIPKLEDLK